ncbi:small ribosomal subunit Rsm22 family protein [Phytoactinopolyspora endophytica]|uniref:small ribosomal subunit Rsm22 family protein n=1 Tax=Phytoactinopolyspora endophytica TaxID=1642495 RepID=UPI00101C4B54|nr:small ribosomal subunit Rsm22 family protein [Phytoactinopolyspora endophytica]
MSTYDDRLSRALSTVLARTRTDELTSRARRLSELYRAAQFEDNGVPILTHELTALAYAAYRMPATVVAVRAALAACSPHVSGEPPQTHLDLGGGTGAAVWAAAETWPGIRSHVLEQSPAAIKVGRRLVRHNDDRHLGSTTWAVHTLKTIDTLPRTDLITMSYVLGELPHSIRASITAQLADAARTVVIVEPGTPDGHARIIEAREMLVDAGMSVVAPCPHNEACPIAGTQDWCHFAARATRTSIHRQIKAGTRNYEDEKFSYVAATRDADPSAVSRIIRRPTYARARVVLTLCQDPPTVKQTVVTRKDRELYRAVRHARWGDTWA